MVINLDGRIDRWKNVQTLVSKLGILFERLSAVNGKNLNAATLKLSHRAKRCIAYGKRTSPLDLDSLGAAGCSLSHIEAWKRIVEKNESALVLEDDATFDPVELGKFLKHCDAMPLDFIQLESHNAPTVSGSMQVGEWNIATQRPWTAGGEIVAGSAAYIVTPKAASILLQNALPLDYSIDYYMHAQLDSLGIQLGYIKLASQGLYLKSPDVRHPPSADEELGYAKGLRTGVLGTLVIAVLLFLLHKQQKESGSGLGT